jgi:hypothetical protein
LALAVDTGLLSVSTFTEAVVTSADAC